VFLKRKMILAAVAAFVLLAPLAGAVESKSKYFFDKGNLYLKKGKLETAIKYFQEAIDIDPYNAEAHNNLGRV
jgi:tetratricopeptide (TPR) repeat protein